MTPGICGSNSNNNDCVTDMDLDMRSNVAMNSNSVSSHLNSIVNVNGNMNGNTNVNTNVNVKEMTEKKKKEEKKEEEMEGTTDKPPSSSNKNKNKFSYPPKSIQESTWIRNIHLDPTQALHERPTIDDIKQWTFDPLLYHDECLTSVFPELIQYYQFDTKYSIPLTILNNFSNEVMKNHRNPLYHNWFHITSVLHMTFMFLTEGGGEEYLDDIDIFALLFGAFIHDVDHTGRNNVFENNSNSVLSQKFQKASPLENNSVAVTYQQILTQPHCNILSGFEREEVEGSTSIGVLKELIKEIVLITDVPTYHGALVKKVKLLQDKVTATFGTELSLSRSTSETESGTPPAAVVSSSSSASSSVVWDKHNTEHRLMLCQVIIKAADISNPILIDSGACKDWALRICTEFKLQYDKEVELDLPIVPFMNVNDEYEMAKCQMGFYMFMALPFFEVVGEVLPKTKFLSQQGTINLNYYKEYIAYVDTRRKSEEEAKDEKEEHKKEDVTVTENGDTKS